MVLFLFCVCSFAAAAEKKGWNERVGGGGKWHNDDEKHGNTRTYV